MQPVPIGVPGELLIGGDGLAREYLNAPELTNEKFVPNPFCKNFDEKLYRTGDLVRWLPDGNLEFLGRLDCQVKIRGFRVELGEIESALAENPRVQQCAVGVHSDKSGTKQIVAYVVPRENLTPNVSDLRAFLETRLPGYMLPARFVFLQKLPLNSSGKVDRRQLPVPTEISAPNPKSIAPRNPTEAALVEIWREVLVREEIGVEEHFFELGGHSLLATRIVSRIAKALNVELPLSAIFEAPTIAGLARAVENRRNKPSENGGPILRRARRPVSPSTEKSGTSVSNF
jgi:acyl carrier protein